MTTDKDFKQVVRARMAATGERYTAARDQLLDDPEPEVLPERRRVLGAETRYAITVDLESGRSLRADEVHRYLFRGVSGGTRSSNVFLANGARLYVTGSLVEYATPECERPRQVLVYQRAGDRLVTELVESARSRIAEQDVGATIHVRVDHGAAGGAHESYSYRGELEPELVASVLVPFLVSRQIYAGCGGLLVLSNGTTRFVLSPHADHVGTPESIANPAAPPHADPERFRRLHVAVGEANRCDIAACLKVGATALVLRLIEEGPDLVPANLRLENPMRAIRQISHDSSLSQKVLLDHGREATALQIQTVVLDAVRSLVAREGATADERRVIDSWQAILGDLGTDPGRLDGVVDWVTGLRAVRTATDALDEAAAREFNAAYDIVDPALVVGQSLCSDDEIGRATTSAPETTRAHLRGAFIDACTAGRRDYTVDWVHLKLNDAAQRTILCKDPLVSEDPRVERLIGAIRGGLPE